MRDASSSLAVQAERAARIARKHPDCLDAAVTSLGKSGAVIALTMNVEMPLAMAATGHSPNGVKVREVVEMTIGTDFPWRDPAFRLRQDFPRELPHLHPGPAGRPPRPCLIDGSQQEFFAQFGLAEAGLFHLLHQLSDWLRKAAVGDLINPAQGWEPVLRNELAHIITIDASFARGLVRRDGGWKVLKADYLRSGAEDAGIDSGVTLYLTSSREAIALKADDKSIFKVTRTGSLNFGPTVAAVIWPDKLPSGKPRIAGRYLPETVGTLADLKARAEDYGCRRSLDGFLGALERKWSGYFLEAPIPIGVILCARRPIHLIGSPSEIELIPYVFEFRAEKKHDGIFPEGDATPVGAAGLEDALSPGLMRELSGTPGLNPIAVLGCGSVGSKLALHAARAGQSVVSLADRRYLRPHNMARHGLLPPSLHRNKAAELAGHLAALGQAPAVFGDDLVTALRDPAKARIIIPANAAAVVNTTASIPVREALVDAAKKRRNARMIETALVGAGNGAFLLASGKKANPNPCDLMAELYATSQPGGPFHGLMFDEAGGLEAIQIGQGCSSMTLRASDVAISAMTAGATDELWRIMAEDAATGTIVTGIKDRDSASTTWSRTTVRSFEVIPIDGSDGWTLRVSRRVIDEIREQTGRWRDVETGGVLVGTASARLKTVTAVDWIDAPPDSRRSAGEFLLGTEGLQAAIESRYASSGKTLYDVGTWHSHLMDQGPSSTDWDTARKLAAERVPPAVLLIASPKRFYALQALPEEQDAG